jgi:2,4-dienoyl-CoA reductase-like NADH-dependent reductase (Old Yellow Enzyme family)
MTPALFTPLTIRGVTFKNRLVVSPMCNYSAHDGVAGEFHLVTVGRYALGGAGLVIVEATAVQANGRITHGCTGLWHDGQIESLAKIARFLSEHGSVPGIQLGHAGRKASMQRPWFGNGALNSDDTQRGDFAWAVQAPSAVPTAAGWLVPKAMSADDIAQLRQDFIAAAKRAVVAGFKVIELHAAHGYLLHSFLSPLDNFRTDEYGGSLDNRMRLVLQIATDIRATVPIDMPLFVRFSAVDDLPDGWTIDDSVVLAKQLKALGVDLIDCSSGGILGSATGAGPVTPLTPRTPGFQVPWAAKIKAQAAMPTMAVGLILTPELANQVIEQGSAELVAIAREALDDPNWPVHAARSLGADTDYRSWPKPFGWWLNVREGFLRKLGLGRVHVAK